MSFTKTIFLTGFPGFIAERLVAELSGNDVQFFLLVQPAFVAKAMTAVKKIAEKTNTPLENYALIEGDITKPQLGVSDHDWSILRSETTDIFHLAAAYDLGIAKDIAYAVNLDGTKNVNELARSVWGLHRYNYISTCYVAGKRTGKILESDLEHTAGFRNFYEETKYLAEIEVKALMSDLPVTIFRPAVVVGDSNTGETVKYDGIYSLILYLLKAPSLLRFANVGNEDVRLNLVPVDFVVNAIAALSEDANAIGKTLAIADPAPLTTGELFNLIAVRLSGKPSSFAPPKQLVKLFLSSFIAPALTGLPHSGVPYFFLSQTYDTHEADTLLQPHGIKCPAFPDYLKNLLVFVKKHPRL